MSHSTSQTTLGPLPARLDVDSGDSCVTVVVVSYNTVDKLRRCLRAIEPRHEVVVVDNASIDGSAAMVASEFPQATLVSNSRNLGFGAANNIGLDHAKRPFVLFLNSDAYAAPGSIDELAIHLDDPAVAAVAGRLTNDDGSVQDSTANRLTLWAVVCEQTLLEKAFPDSRWLSPYWNTKRLIGVADTEQAMGACLMVKPAERFDERYFLYCEDTDLCLRLRRHGVIRYVPSASFEHDLGASSMARRWVAVCRYNRGKELYFRIHHGPLASVACLALDRLGALLRMIGWGLAIAVRPGSAPARVAMWAKVLTAPVSRYVDAS